MFARLNFGWTTDKLSHAAAAHIIFEDLIGIKKITNDQIKTGEIALKIGAKLGILGEESRERPVIDGADAIGVEPIVYQLGDMFVAEHIEFRVRIGFP